MTMTVPMKSALIGIVITVATVFGWSAYRIAAAIVLMNREGSVGYDYTSIKLQFIMVTIKAVATGLLGGLAASFWLK